MVLQKRKGLQMSALSVVIMDCHEPHYAFEAHLISHNSKVGTHHIGTLQVYFLRDLYKNIQHWIKEGAVIHDVRTKPDDWQGELEKEIAQEYVCEREAVRRAEWRHEGAWFLKYHAA
jgi:hypothetical protein